MIRCFAMAVFLSFALAAVASDPLYLIQSSGDLEDWTNETTITPLQFPFALTNQTSLPSRFYRAVGQ
jgi:hypothetical protein